MLACCMSILFAALHQAARAHHAAGGGVSEFPALSPAAVLRPPHPAWWPALLGGIGLGLGFVLAGLWADDGPAGGMETAWFTAPVPAISAPLIPATAPAAVMQAALIEPLALAPVAAITAADTTDSLLPQDWLPAPRDGEAAAGIILPPDQDWPQAPGVAALSITAEYGPAPPAQAVMRAEAEAARGDYPAAIEAYDDALAEDSSNRTALSGKAYALQQSGAWDAALPLWRQLIRDNPRNAAAWAGYAAALSALGDHAGAQQALEQAGIFAPGNPSIRVNLAILADRRGDHTQALTLYREALAAPGDPALPWPRQAIRARAEYLAHDRFGSKPEGFDPKRESYAHDLTAHDRSGDSVSNNHAFAQAAAP